MMTPDEQVRIGFGVIFFVAPVAVGWAGGRSGHGNRFARVFAVHAALATTLGLTGVLLARWYMVPSPLPAASPGPASPPLVSSGRIELFTASEVLALSALPLAIIACGSAVAHARTECRWVSVILLVFLSVIPLVLADSLLTLDFLHEEPNRALLLGACALGACATLAIVVHALRLHGQLKEISSAAITEISG